MSGDPIHFCVFTAGVAGGASGNVSVYLSAGLALDGHTVDLVTLFGSDDTLRRHYTNLPGFAEVNIWWLGAKHARTSLFKLARYFRGRRPAVVFSQMTYHNVLAVLARRLSGVDCLSIPIEGTLISKVGAVDAREVPKLRLVPPLVRLTYPWADGIIGKSADVVADLRQLVGRRLDGVAMTALPNPYPLDRFRTLSLEHATLPWPDGEAVPVIISVGRLANQKGYDVLLPAFAEARAEMPCRLLILGQGPQQRALGDLTRRLGISGDVAMPGRVENPWKYMARCSLFALASRYEGWPSAVIEAMALGLPVVTTDCPGGGKVAVEHNKSGRIVPVDDVAALRGALLALMGNKRLRKRLGHEAKKRADLYDYRVVSRDYAAFARELLKTPD